MPDTTFGTIQIGGVILEEDVEELCEHIKQANLFAGWDGTPGETGATFSPKSIDDLLSYAEEKGFLVMSDCNAIGGIFEDLELFCVERGIDFDRFASALYSAPPEAKKNRKDIGAVDTVTDEDGDNMIREQPARDALDLLSKGKVIDAVTTLKAVVSKSVPDLQPVIFKMNDGTTRTP